MVSTDPIADMLTRIRNAMLVQKHAIVVPHSKMKHTVADVLVANRFLNKAEVVDAKSLRKLLRIEISTEGENPRISHIKRISKPGRRVYSKADEMPRVKNGRGIIVVSTSQGLMTGDQARTKQLGGEIICEVY